MARRGGETSVTAPTFALYYSLHWLHDLRFDAPADRTNNLTAQGRQKSNGEGINAT